MADEIKPPVVGIAPLSALIWDKDEITPETTIVIDSFGYTYLTLFIEVNRPTRITLAEVSQDGTTWRRVEEHIKAFDRADKVFVNLNEILETKAILMYRFFKIRLDAEAPVVITLELASKLIDMLPVLQEIRDSLTIEKVLKVPVSYVPFLDVLEKILGYVKTEVTNLESWDHDQKNVTIPGDPVQLPPLIVPDGFSLVIKAKATNIGNVYLGKSKELAEDSTKRVPLSAKEATELRVKKASAVWVYADNDGEGVVFWCEKEE